MAEETKLTVPFITVIPQSVRADKKLSKGAKLHFGDISALSSKFGYCYATNEQLAGITDESISTISRYITELVKGGHITSVVESKMYFHETKLNEKGKPLRLYTKRRKLYVGDAFTNKKEIPPEDKPPEEPIGEEEFKKSSDIPRNEEIGKEGFKKCSDMCRNEVIVDMCKNEVIDDMCRNEVIINNKPLSKKPRKNKPPEKVGVRDFVFLSKEELVKLEALYQNKSGLLELMLDLLDSYKDSKGKKYKSDYGVLKRNGWVHKRAVEQLGDKKSQGFQKDTRPMAKKIIDFGEED
jgi:DNA-binding transcriptional ArsR family regulator